MNDNLFWLKLWMLVIPAVCVIILSLAFEDAYIKYVMLEAIKSGADPLVIKCAFATPSDGNILLCSGQIK